jgi:all-trans-retinol 13,14-reductase
MIVPGIRSYVQNPPEGDWDAIVIGSGMSGLTCAALMAHSGRRVLVLERHYTAGGFTHVFRRGDYEWDVGVHYIGEVHRPTSLLSATFRYLTDGKLEWAEMGEVVDRVHFGNEEFELRAGVDAFVEHLQRRFPSEPDRGAIEDYVTSIRAIGKAYNTFATEKAMPGPVSVLFGGLMRRRFLRDASRTTREVMEERFRNPVLRGVLAAQYGDYGLPPGQSSFAMHAMVASHYLRGGAYPVGGSSRIAETVADVIASEGGTVLTKAEVERILVEGGTAVGVRMADGRELRAPLVISSAGIANTFGRLIGKDDRARLGVDDLSRKIEPSFSHLGLYLGFRQTATELGLRKANRWIYPEDGYDHDENVRAYLEDPDANFPLVYVSFPSAKDPDWERRYPGRATVDVITLAPYDWFAKWEETRWHKRGEDYDAFKRRMTDRLLEVLYRYEPQLRGKLDHCEMSTPLSTRHFVNYAHGEIYGLAHSPDRFKERFLRPKTPVRKLWLTGQDIATCGVAGAVASGVVTMSAIDGKNWFKRIRKASG